MTKRAQDFVEELARSVTWLEDTQIVLKEKLGKDPAINWVATTGPLSEAPTRQFEAAVAEWHARALQLDWEGAEFEGDRRVVLRWVSV